jgi:hypothetical protein
MSFDLYFEPATQGKPLAISRAELRSLFPVIEEDSEPDYWKIQYDPLNVCHIGVKSSKPGSDTLSSFHVERPCGAPRFWEALFQVLKSGPIVLYFPGGPPLVANEQVTETPLKDAGVSLGEPRRVDSAAGILKIIGEQ